MASLNPSILSGTTGGLHVLNVVMHQTELVRSWASDVVGMFDPDYLWHDMGQAFQTAQVGEQMVEAMLAGSTEDRSQRMADFGLRADVAASIGAAQSPQMGTAILKLYRSACQPALADAGRALENAAARPGLSILATDDPDVGSHAIRRRAADRSAPRLRCSTGWGIGGCCRTPISAPRPSLGSGCRLIDDSSAVVSH